MLSQLNNESIRRINIQIQRLFNIFELNIIKKIIEKMKRAVLKSFH